MNTRIEAIQQLRFGHSIQHTFTNKDLLGKKTTLHVVIRMMNQYPLQYEAVIDCPSLRKSYYITLTSKQLLTFLRKHYTSNSILKCKPVPHLVLQG